MQIDGFSKALLMLDQWKSLTQLECENIARELDSFLPASFRFHKVVKHSLENQESYVVIFEWVDVPARYGHAFFALIPGGETVLGYDREQPFIPNKQQQESWKEETEKRFALSLNDYLDRVMTPLRHVTIQPFLLEILATPLSSPPVFDESLGPSGGWKRYAQPISYEKTLLHISKQGFRFATSDEWEYACAAGSRTLFRWGNTTPTTLHPLLRAQKPVVWDRHMQENAFGLFIARYPYHWEFTTEREIIRGGDGGAAMHASAGTFATWLTLASAFHEKRDQESIYDIYLRRAFSLDMLA